MLRRAVCDMSPKIGCPPPGCCFRTGPPADHGGYLSGEPFADVHRVDALDVDSAYFTYVSGRQLTCTDGCVRGGDQYDM